MRLLDRGGLSEKGLRVSKSNLYRLLEAGELPMPIKIGRRSYWSEAEIDEYIADKLAKRMIAGRTGKALTGNLNGVTLGEKPESVPPSPLNPAP